MVANGITTYRCHPSCELPLSYPEAAVPQACRAAARQTTVGPLIRSATSCLPYLCRSASRPPLGLRFHRGSFGPTRPGALAGLGPFPASFASSGRVRRPGPCPSFPRPLRRCRGPGRGVRVLTATHKNFLLRNQFVRDTNTTKKFLQFKKYLTWSNDQEKFSRGKIEHD